MVLIKTSSCDVVHGQLVTASNQTAKDGDAEVVITCNYSQVTSIPDGIKWDEVNENGGIINPGIVNNNKKENGRFTLHTDPARFKASLVMSHPLRNDSQRIFQCQITTRSGNIQLSNPSILTVYYLEQPLLFASGSVINEGQSVTFTCSVPDGDHIPYITWYKDGQTVNTNNPSRYEIANNNTESVLKIKSATEEDGGRYTCKAESDQFKGDDAKTSEGKNLIIIGYNVTVKKPNDTTTLKNCEEDIHITFTSEDGLATCTAEGHPKPSSVLILQEGEGVEKGENTATIEINDEICQSSLTCYAENGKLNKTMTLENCTKDITVTFTSEDGLATCTAEGHPKPSSVLILQDGEVVKKGEYKATIKIDKMCYLTCYAENEKINDTTTLENSKEGSGSSYIVPICFAMVVVVVLTVVVICLLLCKKRPSSRSGNTSGKKGNRIDDTDSVHAPVEPKADHESRNSAETNPDDEDETTKPLLENVKKLNTIEEEENSTKEQARRNCFDKKSFFNQKIDKSD
ncbi:neogenin-like [Antedon mediterranea]|uniref:neogenin-like n=1 Tax=Antedon mediterranea TaxID=105859 RepID=UPI003AF5BE12